MVDLDVYRVAGRVLLAGGDVYNLPVGCRSSTRPFAALLAVPLTVLPEMRCRWRGPALGRLC